MTPTMFYWGLLESLTGLFRTRTEERENVDHPEGLDRVIHVPRIYL